MYFNDVEKIPLPNDLMDNIILTLKYFSMAKNPKITMRQWYLDVEDTNEEQFKQLLKDRIYPGNI